MTNSDTLETLYNESKRKNERLHMNLVDVSCKIANLEKENEKLKKQNKGFIHLLESVQSVLSNQYDKDIILSWIKENVCEVYKKEKKNGYPFDWI